MQRGKGAQCRRSLHWEETAEASTGTSRPTGERALKLSALTGTLLAFLICLAVVAGIGLASLTQHAALGVVLAVFMACFEIAAGRCFMRRKWVKIWSDFAPRTGNYLLFGLVALALVPMVVFWMREA
jgi:hypothetical protein